jgi:putative salt-induced outer membrane protein
MKKNLIAAMALIAAGTATAAENGWSGEGQLGFTYARGNTDTDVINAALTLKKESEQWLHEIGIVALRAKNNGEINAKRYEVQGKSGYKIDENDYVFGSVRYDHDSFTGFDYTYTLGLGWGHIFFENDDQHLITELGLGYKVTAIDIDRSEENETVAIGKLDYERKLTDTVSFTDVLLVEAGSNNTFIQNDAGFSFKVSESMDVKLAYQWRHDSEVPEGFDKTDTLFSANLVYGF